MKTVKLMVVNAKDEHRKKFIGQVFDATVRTKAGREKYHIIGRDGLPGYSVNPIETDEDLTVRIGFDHDDILFHLRKVSKASHRKLLVRALKVIAKERGYTNAYVRRYGECANIGDWARQWADWYIGKDGRFNSSNTDWLHGTEHDPVDGHEFREFMQAEFDSY